MALISTLFILLFRVVLLLFRGPRKDEGEKKKIMVILQWQNEMAQISHQIKGMSGYGWLVKHGKA